MKKIEWLCAVGNTFQSVTYSGFPGKTVVLDRGVCITVTEESLYPITWSGSLFVLDPTLYFERLVSENMPAVMSMLILPNLLCSGKFSLGERLSSFWQEAHVLKGKAKQSNTRQFQIVGSIFNPNVLSLPES